MKKFVEHRIADRRIVRLIQKWLKAGVMEEGRWIESEQGTPQGSVISPILANVYLHYVLDLWVDQWRRKKAVGDVIIVRYADDAVLGFQYRKEAARFLEELRERLARFGLELHPEKTRLIEFGRYAAADRKRRGERRPETFSFLGFTHICGTNQATGYFIIQRKTMGKRMATKLKEIKATLRLRLHRSLADTIQWLQSLVRGYFQYHAIPGNEVRLRAFRHDVLRLWMHQLRRRSQRSSWTWERFKARLGILIPEVRILHPYPAYALPPPTQGRNRVRQSRQHGSVRGVPGNRYPYRDRRGSMGNCSSSVSKYPRPPWPSTWFVSENRPPKRGGLS